MSKYQPEDVEPELADFKYLYAKKLVGRSWAREMVVERTYKCGSNYSPMRGRDTPAFRTIGYVTVKVTGHHTKSFGKRKIPEYDILVWYWVDGDPKEIPEGNVWYNYRGTFIRPVSIDRILSFFPDRVVMIEPLVDVDVR